MLQYKRILPEHKNASGSSCRLASATKRPLEVPHNLFQYPKCSAVTTAFFGILKYWKLSTSLIDSFSQGSRTAPIRVRDLISLIKSLV